jgi:hypothetical protein
LLEGLSEFPQDVKDYIDRVWLDIFPQTTRELDAWEDALGVYGEQVTPLFVACSETGTNRIMTSTDATSWTSQTVESSLWEDICFSPELGLFCAVGSVGTNRCVTSPDGINWTTRAISGSYTWKAVIWSPGLGLFCAVANGTDQVTTSPDGITWTLRTALEANTWNAISWSEHLGLFAVVSLTTSGTYDIMTSPDGINWTGIEIGTDGWRDIAYSDNLKMFCVVGTTGSNRVLTSTDGVNWTFRTCALSTWISVTAAGTYGFVSVAISGGGINKVQTSPDGITWTSRAAAEDTSWLGVTWNNHSQILCAVAASGTNRTMYSTDGGVTWTGVAAAEANLWSSVVAEGVMREQTRRDRLEREWKPSPGQSPTQIQDVLQANGFDVYVHDWFYFANELTDGDMETAGVAAWPVFNSAVITKDVTDPYSGTQNLRLTYGGGTGFGTIKAALLTVGQMYQIHGWAKSDGTAIPVVRTNTTSFIWTGTTSTAWQEFDVRFVADGTDFYLYTEAGAGYVEFDDIQLDDLSAPLAHDPNDLIGSEIAGNPLVNKILRTERNYTVECGDDSAFAGENNECGEAHMECGNYDGFSNLYKIYPIPTDTDQWKNFIYIGGETIDDALDIDENRRSEFEDLCLKICPAEKWIGLIRNTVPIYAQLNLENAGSIAAFQAYLDGLGKGDDVIYSTLSAFITSESSQNLDGIGIEFDFSDLDTSNIVIASDEQAVFGGTQQSPV